MPQIDIFLKILQLVSFQVIRYVFTHELPPLYLSCSSSLHYASSPNDYFYVLELRQVET